MATIEIKGDQLVVGIHGWDIVLALRSPLTMPLSSVKGATATPPAALFDGLKGLKVAGGILPHAFAAGYFWVTGTAGHTGQHHALDHLERASKVLEGFADDMHIRTNDVKSHIQAATSGIRDALRDAGAAPLAKYLAFYDVHMPERAIGIDVEHGRLRQVVVEIDNESPESCVTRILAAIPKH